MSHILNKLSTCTKVLVGALALVLVGMSHASGVLVGGGSTLPSVGYVGSGAANPPTLQFFGSSIASGSLFAAPGVPAVSYCQIGSGAGKNVLAGGTIGGVTYSVLNYCSSNKTGFGALATGVGRTDLTQPNFAATDSPLSVTDITRYQNGHGSSALPTQFPVMVGAVAIGFNLRDSSSTRVTSAMVNLSTLQVCRIFSGEVSDWNDPSLYSAFTLPPGHSIPSTPINVQYRQDDNGTSFSLGNYLSNNCASLGARYIFQTSQTFGSTTPGSGGTPAAGSVVSGWFTTMPSNWTSVAGGNTGMAYAIAQNGASGSSGNGNIGIMDTAYYLALPSTFPVTQIANVAGKSPITNFGSALILPAAAVVYNYAISSINNADGTAAIYAISGITTQCIALVPPANYAVAGSKGGIVPLTSYPIVAMSYFLGNAQANGTDLTNTVTLLNAPYSSTVRNSVTTVGAGTGLAFLSPPRHGAAAFTATAPGACLH